MCQNCEMAFDFVAKDFEGVLECYRQDIAAGRVEPTVAQRAKHTAILFHRMAVDNGPMLLAFYLAVAVERLIALEDAGIPT